ncbi:MAG TPA: sulfur carrier protein ThiS [Opitutaceae bacterium]|jgi:sulfur carrier protein
MSAPAGSPAVFVNDVAHPMPAPPTLAALLGGLGLAERRGIAAAVNGEVVPRSGWTARPIALSDRVVVIRPAQGG